MKCEVCGDPVVGLYSRLTKKTIYQHGGSVTALGSGDKPKNYNHSAKPEGGGST